MVKTMDRGTALLLVLIITCIGYNFFLAYYTKDDYKENRILYILFITLSVITGIAFSALIIMSVIDFLPILFNRFLSFPYLLKLTSLMGIFTMYYLLKNLSK